MNYKETIINLLKGLKKIEEWANTIDWELLYNSLKYEVEELPREIEILLVELMNRGWFIWFPEGSILDFQNKREALLGKNIILQDEFMIKYISNNQELIKEILIKNYPNRYQQIVDAFQAHSFSLYYSSIPTFLALAEGIGKQHYPKAGIYAKKPGTPGTPKTAKIIENIDFMEDFEVFFLKPLKISSTLTKSINNPSDYEKEQLNRHLIMHGNSDKYGSQMNSLKAISFLYFVHESLIYLKEQSINN